jgi:hypothetical protein
MKAAGNIDENTKVGAILGGNGVNSPPPVPPLTPFERPDLALHPNGQEIGMNLSYTINLNLPQSSDPEVFNAIFKALKEHLLSR